MKSFSILLVFFTSALLNFQANAFDLPDKALSFKYISIDGDIQYSCTHKRAHEIAPLWDVICGQGVNERRYLVSLIIRGYHGETDKGFASYEILFSIIDKSKGEKSMDSGASTWIQFDRKARLEAITLNQSVEDDIYRLWLNFYPSKVKIDGK